MDENWERKKSWSRSPEKGKKDKDKKKKKKHHISKDRSRSHHKKKKKQQQPQKKQKERQKQVVKEAEIPKLSPVKQIEENPEPVKVNQSPVEARSKSEKKKKKRTSRQNSEKKKRKDSRDNSQKKKKKHKDKKEKRDRSSHSQRSRSRQKKKKKDNKDDRDHRSSRRDEDHRRDRKRRSYDRKDNFRYDSPESQVKDDPLQLEKLSQLKAAKQLVSSKADRKLYLGNLPPNITSQQLMEMLNSALKKMDINTDVEGDSIVSAWISPDGVGHYAFVEFRTAQQATNGLTLNGASLFGYQLKLGRPKQYIEYNKALLSEIGTDKNLETIIKKVASLGKEQLPPIEERIIAAPSKIIVLKHIVSIQELGIDEEYSQILEDVKDMAKRFGEVQVIFIPRPHQTINLELAPTRVKGLGLIFIEYKSIYDAKVARSRFVQKQFCNRPVACSFFEQKKYRSKEYDIQDKVIIDF